jgi:signal transduction histidine kinase
MHGTGHWPHSRPSSEMKRSQGTADLRAIAKFQVTKSQYFIALIALVAILALGFSTFNSSNSKVEQAQLLSNVETPAASIIFTQRETLAYATRLAQWANGGIARRNVQIARSLLAQRLAVIDTSGLSMGSRAGKQYWSVLFQSDQLVASAPPGILPQSLHIKYGVEVQPIIDEILAEARKLVVSYQRSIDLEVENAAQEAADREKRNLALFYVFLIAGTLFLVLNVKTNFLNYRRASVALREEKAQLDETILQLQRAQTTVTELQDLNQAKNAFISTVNHELRTPLTSIIGYLDVIRDEKLVDQSSDLHGYLDVLERNAQILLHLVESTLALSKIDSSTGEIERSKVNLNEVIDNAIFILKPVSDKRNISIAFTATDEFAVYGNFGQLNQVFINLLGNAVKFSHPDSLVSINMDLSRDPSGVEYARVAIKDTGIGIPKADQEHLFSRFFRATNADSGQYPGNGLGLAIVEQVVKSHSGFIHLTSEQGVGTTFTVEFPTFLSEEELLVLGRREDVLRRAIVKLEAATPLTIKSITHDIGGSIGFYNFIELGEEILKYSRSIEKSGVNLIDFADRKRELLELMQKELSRVIGGGNV